MKKIEGWGSFIGMEAISPSHPLISIVVLVRSDDHLLHLTFDSLVSQEEKNFEVILLDATGRGSALARRLQGFPVQIQEARMDPLAEVMNQGLFLSQGTYVQFLMPGDRLLSQQTTSYMGRLASESRWPEIVYCAFLQRDPEEPPSAATYPLNLEFLRRGTAPTLSRAYWFRKNAVQEMGGFDPRCQYRPSFDLLCRLLSNRETRAVYTRRVLTDHEWRRKSASEMIGYAAETCRILYRHFGPWHALRWVFVQDQRHLLRWSWKMVKEAFWRSN